MNGSFRLRTLHILILAVLVSACGTPSVKTNITDVGSPFLTNCHDLYTAVDRAVFDEGVMDAEGMRLPGFPYLRSNRFLASLSDRSDDREYLRAWLDRLINLDLQGRRVEIDNLSSSVTGNLAGMSAIDLAGQETRLTKLAECATAFREFDLTRPKRLEMIRTLSRVDDEYSLLYRILGLYPLTRYPVYRGFQQWKDRHLVTFTIPNRQKQWSGRPVIYRPADSPGQPLAPESVAELINAARDPQLGIPQPATDDLRRLARQFAPVFLVDEAGDFDRIGTPRWTKSRQPAVDTSRPVVFVRPAWTWFGETILLQLVYTLWFPERPAASAWDILSGRLDGIIWRITIDHDGRPLIADSIHPCGCYHLFFPAKGLEKTGTDRNALEEDNLTPQTLPADSAGDRLVIRIASASHYVESISAGAGIKPSWSGRSYHLSVDHPVPEYSLRSIPLPDRGSASLYRQDGMIDGTERRERWLLWPTGVKSPGAMRQWGKHATAFVGRRHFDDPYLLDDGFTRTGND